MPFANSRECHEAGFALLLYDISHTRQTFSYFDETITVENGGVVTQEIPYQSTCIYGAPIEVVRAAANAP